MARTPAPRPAQRAPGERSVSKGWGGWREPLRTAPRSEPQASEASDRLVADQDALAALEARAHAWLPAGDLGGVLRAVDRHQPVEHRAVLLLLHVRSERGRGAEGVAAEHAADPPVVADPDARAREPAPEGARLPRILRGDQHDAAVEPAEPDLAVAAALGTRRQQRRHVDEAALLEQGSDVGPDARRPRARGPGERDGCSEAEPDQLAARHAQARCPSRPSLRRHAAHTPACPRSPTTSGPSADRRLPGPPACTARSRRTGSPRRAGGSPEHCAGARSSTPARGSSPQAD